MKRTWPIWIGFALCLTIVLAAMGWMSLTALRLDRAEAAARRQTAWEENVRLALWRMDSFLGPFVAQEGVRPYSAYHAFTAMFSGRGSGERLIPSSLLSEPAPNVLVYFQFEPDGRLSSPQVPGEKNYDRAVPNHTSQQAVRRAEAQLRRVGTLVDRRALLGRLAEIGPGPVGTAVSPLGQTSEQRLAQRTQREIDLQNRGRGAVEFDERNTALQQQANVLAQNWRSTLLSEQMLPSSNVGGVLMTPLWIDGNLILARRVATGGRQYVQGCLLDWPAIRTSLLESVADLLPNADLEPVAEAPLEEEARMLAALPVRLTPGAPIGSEGAAGWTGGPLSPRRLSLLVAWGCVLLAAAAVAALLVGVMRLAGRRASFVTAVTHELRTPLTTFQMYAEMLAEGMVTDPRQQREYLVTLRAEAARLTHMVENVLAYARLERGRSDGRRESVTLERLVGPIAQRLAGRAEGAGMQLVVEADAAADQVTVRANVAAVEQVLLNLVDNACKYASDAADKRIHLAVECDGGTARLGVRDHGPGVAEPLRRRLFRSFAKSAQEAAQTAPGVGLGLALSRRLARAMGGDLRFDGQRTDGARFVLTLPTLRPCRDSGNRSAGGRSP